MIPKWYVPNGLTLDEVRSRIIDAALRGEMILKHQKYSIQGAKYYRNAIVLNHNEYIFIYQLDGTEEGENYYQITGREALTIIKDLTDGKP